MHASVTMGAGAGVVAVVGRARRWRDRRADAGPLGDRRRRRRDGPGLRPRAPVHEGPVDSYRFGDERYTVSSNVRGTRHVLMTLDEETSDVGTGVARMGADHPIAWCRMFEGARDLGLEPWTLLRRLPRERRRRRPARAPRRRRRTTSPASPARTRTAAATVWTNFRRTVMADDMKGRDRHGRRARRQGLLDRDRRQAIPVRRTRCGCRPQTRATSTLLTLQTRADNRSVQRRRAGMALEPNFAATAACSSTTGRTPDPAGQQLAY